MSKDLIFHYIVGIAIGVVLTLSILLLIQISVPAGTEVGVMVECVIREIDSTNSEVKFLVAKNFDADTSAEKTCHDKYGSSILVESKLIQLGK